MSNKWTAGLKSFGKFLGYGVAALALAGITEHGLWSLDWVGLGRDCLSFAVIGAIKAAMTYLKTENTP